MNEQEMPPATGNQLSLTITLNPEHPENGDVSIVIKEILMDAFTEIAEYAIGERIKSVQMDRK